MGLEGFVAAFGFGVAVWAAVSMAAGGFAKGVVGFALPLVGLSGMASVMPFEVAVALLILPTLVANALQATRDGFGEAWDSLLKFWRLNLVLVVMIALCAQLVVALPEWVLFALLGAAITVFGLSQLAGWRPRIAAGARRSWEVATGVIGGFFGGISGIWGPPVVMFLLAAEVPKVEMVRVQAIGFLLGSLVLLGAHLASGILNAVTLPMSAWLILPTVLAMFGGYAVQDRLDQALFRRVTLVVLVVAGVNLLRRAVTG